MELTIGQLVSNREVAANGWDKRAFEIVFSERYPEVVRLLEKMLGNRASAEEHALEAFCRLHERPEISGAGHNTRAWLHRTATRLGLDALRASSRRTRNETLAADEQGQTASTPLDGVLASERSERVRSILAELKPRQAQLLLMRHSGYSYTEIAAALDLQATSIGALLGRAEAEFGRRYQQTSACTESLFSEDGWKCPSAYLRAPNPNGSAWSPA